MSSARQTGRKARRIEIGDPVEILKSIRRTEARNTLSAINSERDPQKLIELGESTYYEGRLAVVNHSNVPTAYLLYIAEYRNPRIPTNGLIPGPKQPDPHVTENIRKAAVKRLKERNWHLTTWETINMTEGDAKAITARLDAHALKHSPPKGAPGHKPFDDIVDSLVGRIRKDDVDPTSFSHD